MSKAIFLGSFNPPHKGHYDCVKSVIESGQMEKLGIDKIHVIPCRQNPNKAKFHTSFIARYKMCESIFRDLIIDGKVVIDDIENEMLPEYTYDLLRYFHSGNDAMIKDDFWWIITNETFNEIWEGKWKESEWLLANNTFIVLEDNLDKDNWPHYYDIRVVQIPLINHCDIHSTELRAMVKSKKSIENFTNKDVQEFINEYKLYLNE